MTKPSFEIEMTIGEGEGATQVIFTTADILSATLVEQVDPISLTLPISELSFRIFTTDPRFGIYADNEFSQNLQMRQPVKLWLTYGLSRLLVGTYYLDNWKSPAQYRYEFTAVDLIGLMDSLTYDGGFWETDTSILTILGAILDQYAITYSISEDLSITQLRGFAPPSTVREAVQQVAIGAGATVLCVGNKAIQLVPAKLPYRGELATHTIGVEDRLENQEINIKQIVTSIELIPHEYVSQHENIETIFAQTLIPGNYKIVFTKPYYNIETTGVGYPLLNLATEDECLLVTEDEIELVVSEEYVYGPNYILLTVYPPGGDVTITGYPLIENKQSYQFEESGLSPTQTKNKLKIENATLISNTNAQSILDLIRDYYRQRYEQKARTIKTTNYGEGVEFSLIFQIGEIAKIAATDNKMIRGAIEQIDYDLVGGMLAKLRIVGVEDGD